MFTLFNRFLTYMALRLPFPASPGLQSAPQLRRYVQIATTAFGLGLVLLVCSLLVSQEALAQTKMFERDTIDVPNGDLSESRRNILGAGILTRLGYEYDVNKPVTMTPETKIDPITGERIQVTDPATGAPIFRLTYTDKNGRQMKATVGIKILPRDPRTPEGHTPVAILWPGTYKTLITGTVVRTDWVHPAPSPELPLPVLSMMSMSVAGVLLRLRRRLRSVPAMHGTTCDASLEYGACGTGVLGEIQSSVA